MSLVSELKTFEQKAAAEVVKVNKSVVASILPFLEKAEVSAPTIEAITALISPVAAKVEIAGFALLGVAITAIEAAEAAGAAGGVSISLDSAAIADIKALIPAIAAVKLPVGVPVIPSPTPKSV